jgi:LCP family protein required for cell wall assembly
MALAAKTKSTSSGSSSLARSAIAKRAIFDISDFSRKLTIKYNSRVRKRRRRSRIITGFLGVLLSIALAGVGTVYGYYKTVVEPSWNIELSRDPSSGEIAVWDAEFYEDVFVPPAEPLEPFYVLLLGIDNYLPDDVGRSDAMLLCYVDPGQRKVALISIPRDLKVSIPGWGIDKINAAYPFGEIEHRNYLAGLRSTDSSGPALAVRTVASISGVDIAYFVKIDYYKFENMVSHIGGVYVEVPIAVRDRSVGPINLAVGSQVLNGQHAMTFVRSRNFSTDNYQRQTNQRTFIQAFMKQILADDIATVTNTLADVASFVQTNMTMEEIIQLAIAFQGIQEFDFYTYYMPSYPQYDEDRDASFVVMQENQWRSLIERINSGEFPEPTQVGLRDDYLGVVPASYHSGYVVVSHQGILPAEACSMFSVDVRNGCGIVGLDTKVMQILSDAGYQPGEIANTREFVYPGTLIIYRNESERPLAEDIARRLGYGRIILSQDRYTFDSTILVVVGRDIPNIR